jgi:hypothetical protein
MLLAIIIVGWGAIFWVGDFCTLLRTMEVGFGLLRYALRASFCYSRHQCGAVGVAIA